MITRMNDSTHSDESAAAAPQGDASYHHGDLRAALIDAAIDILDSESPEALTLRGVAAKAGVSHAAPRNHFGDFAGLRAAVSAEGFARLGAALGVAVDRPARADRATAVIEAYTGFARANIGLFGLMYGRGPQEDPDAVIGPAARDALAPFALAARGLEISVIGPRLEGDASAAYYLWTLAHGHAQLACSGAHGHMAPDGAALDFRRIVPAPRFAQAYSFETLEIAPGAPSLAPPKSGRRR